MGKERKLSPQFMRDLNDEDRGRLFPILELVRNDRDLILEIRNNALNIYYKGHSLLQLERKEKEDEYEVGKISDKFSVPATTEVCFRTRDDAKNFVEAVPQMKQNIATHRSGRGTEIEFEQMLIRANNYEFKLNTEYFIIDRQITFGSRGRPDLIAIHWSRAKRRRHQEVALALLELKYSLNPDIGQLHNQLSRYYGTVAANVERISQEAQTLLRQKIALSLFNQSRNRVEALRTLTISRRIEDVRFVVVLMDYNPHSRKLDTDALKQLPFAEQVHLFYVGYGLWDLNRAPVTKDGGP